MGSWFYSIDRACALQPSDEIFVWWRLLPVVERSDFCLSSTPIKTLGVWSKGRKKVLSPGFFDREDCTDSVNAETMAQPSLVVWSPFRRF
jgi:hypothetical protein